MLYRGSTNKSEEHYVPLVQQSDNVIIVSSTYKLRNNSRIESTSGWSNSNPTFTPVNNVTLNTTTDVSVQAMLNTKHNHQLRRGAGIRDSLPGIKNKFG